MNEEVKEWPVPDCELNPGRFDCVACKCFKNYGICSHVLALNHVLQKINLRRELMEIGKSAAGRKGGGNHQKPLPALQRQKQREPDSSDEEEDRLLLQGEQGQ